MDRAEIYRNLIQELLREYASIKPYYGEVEFETIFDTASDRYQLMTVGWDYPRRVYGCVAHLDIKNGKIWIQHDGTEEGIANRLCAAGVPKEDIVLAFHPPYKRTLHGFAAA